MQCFGTWHVFEHETTTWQWNFQKWKSEPSRRKGTGMSFGWNWSFAWKMPLHPLLPKMHKIFGFYTEFCTLSAFLGWVYSFQLTWPNTFTTKYADIDTELGWKMFALNVHLLNQRKELYLFYGGVCHAIARFTGFLDIIVDQNQQLNILIFTLTTKKMRSRLARTT